jgi:hypothetical protein
MISRIIHCSTRLSRLWIQLMEDANIQLVTKTLHKASSSYSINQKLCISLVFGIMITQTTCYQVLNIYLVPILLLLCPILDHMQGASYKRKRYFSSLNVIKIKKLNLLQCKKNTSNKESRCLKCTKQGIPLSMCSLVIT